MPARLPSAVLVVTGALVLVLSGAAAAQTPPAAPAPDAPPAGDVFTYSPDGRRDPFVSLIARGSEPRGRSGEAGAGLAGLAVAELSVRGVVQTGRGPVAMVQAPDGRTYLARANDQLLDGTIKTVTPDGLVILQEVNDPLSLVKQREIRKLLRGIEEGK